MDMVQEVLLNLVRSGLGAPSEGVPSGFTEWDLLIKKAFDSCVAAISVDGYNALLQRGAVAQVSKYEWYASVLQAEIQYKRYAPKVYSLCQLFSDNGLRPVLLKGLGLGLDYEIPEHRPIGDIDIYFPDGKSLQADLLIRDKLGVKVTKSRVGHHSHLMYKGVLVENHYELSNTYSGRESIKRFEKRLVDLASKDLRKPSEDCPFYLPSANFNALFLMWHMGTHFYYGGLVLRQLCDWYCFLKAHHGSIDWPMAKEAWRDAGLSDFASAIAALMIEYFAMPSDWMKVDVCSKSVKDAHRIFEDTLSAKKRRKSNFSKVLRYFKSGWKYRIITGMSGLIPVMKSAVLHLFRRADMKEKEI